MFPSKVSGLKSQNNISYFAHEHILLFSHTYHRSFTSGHNRFLGRLAQALLIRARILLTVLPDTNKGVRGKNNEIKRSFTISSEVIFGSRSPILTITLASSTALVHSAICTR